MDRVGEGGKDSRGYQVGAWVLRAKHKYLVAEADAEWLRVQKGVTPVSLYQEGTENGQVQAPVCRQLLGQGLGLCRTSRESEGRGWHAPLFILLTALQ